MSAYITKGKVIAIGGPLLLGQIVGVIQGPETLECKVFEIVDRFKKINKPSWCPPIPAFPIVWTALYCFMGYASYIVWTYGGFDAQRGPLMVYGLQLILNLLWPIIFFKQKKLKVAMVENLALLATASLTANSFWRVDRFAGKLMIPYLVWLVLANLLNANIAMNNSSGGKDPKLDDLYHPTDKRNPGERGNLPASASMQFPSTSGPRSRGRLTVMAQAAVARPQLAVTKRTVRPQIRKAQQPQHALMRVSTPRMTLA